MSVVLIMPHTEQMMKSTFQGCWTTLGKALAILKSYVSRMPNSTSRFVASRTTSTPPAAPPTSSSRRTTSRTRPSEKWQGAIFNHILGKARSFCGCLSWIKPMTPFFKLLKPYSSSGYISLKGLTIFICHGFNEQMQQKEDSTEYTKMGDFKIKLWALAFKPAAFWLVGWMVLVPLRFNHCPLMLKLKWPLEVEGLSPEKTAPIHQFQLTIGQQKATSLTTSTTTTTTTTTTASTTMLGVDKLFGGSFLSLLFLGECSHSFPIKGYFYCQHFRPTTGTSVDY